MKKRMLCVVCVILLILQYTYVVNPVQAVENEAGGVSWQSDYGPKVLTEEELALETEMLVDILLECGYARSLIYINTHQFRYTTLFDLYNIFEELELRADAASELLERLIAFCSNSETWDTYDRLNVEMLILLLEREHYQSQLSDKEMEEFINLIYEENSDYLPYSTSVAIGDTSYDSRFGITYTLVDFAETVSGIAVPLYQADKELKPVDIQGYIDTHSVISDVDYLASPSAMYNCHSYAWYSQSIYNQYWINHADIYVNDAHTIETVSVLAEIGDLVVYYDGSKILHSAVIVQNDGDGIICVSKWGKGGLYRHAYNIVPKEYYPNTSSPNVKYYHVVDEHEYSTLSSTSGLYHVYECNLCDKTNSNYHTYSYSIATETHTGTCTVCGKTVTSAHSLEKTANSNGTTHTIRCTVCGASTTSAHSYSTVANSDGTTHTRTCSVCNYSVSQTHTFTTVSHTNAATHTMKCKYCTQTRSSAHTLNAAGTMCTVCLYKGPFAAVQKIEEDIDYIN